MRSFQLPTLTASPDVASASRLWRGGMVLCLALAGSYYGTGNTSEEAKTPAPAVTLEDSAST